MTKSFHRNTLRQMTKLKEYLCLVFEIKLTPGGCLALFGAKKMYMTIIFKHLSETTRPIKAKFYVELFWEEGTNL